MLHTTVADLQMMLKDLPPEMPVSFTEGVGRVLKPKKWPVDLATRLSLAHAYLFRAKEVIGSILAEADGR